MTTATKTQKHDESDDAPKAARTWDPSKSTDPDKNLDPRLERALTVINKDADDRAAKHKAIAREVATDWNAHRSDHDFDREVLVGDLRVAIAAREREVYGKPTCPKCGSTSLALAKISPTVGTVGGSPVGDENSTLIRCNQCGYTPPA